MISHRWDISTTEAIALQRALAGRVLQTPLSGNVRTIAGTDCAFLDGGKRIVAAAVLCDAATLETIATAHVIRPCRFPYVPGLLSFREAPAVIEAVGKLPHRPDLLMCDGQGIAHPRRLGLAAHVGLWVDVPTIGVAKSRLCGEHRPVGVRRGCRVQLRDGREVIGAVVRTRTAVKPLYVSVGHRITLAEAVAWTLRCARRYRLPVPARQGHLLVGRLKRAGGCPQRGLRHGHASFA
ncbi:MAG TPA: deoxyribonuclease V [Phycisphaerae bacterium]|nr:deoxyribonuclease V [Phycisphaerae bacterium]HUU21191.1 deoxyribonuclease V [Phycisphaerae bacterium]